MFASLDGQSVFGGSEIEVIFGSVKRAYIERAAAGVDGVVSIDLGKRGRSVTQKGVLQGKSRSELNERIKAIGAFIDGKAHTLVTNNGERVENLRVDSFKSINERASGSGLVCDYEIVYTQLKV